MKNLGGDEMKEGKEDYVLILWKTILLNFQVDLSWKLLNISLVLCSLAEEFLKLYWNEYEVFYSLSVRMNQN